MEQVNKKSDKLGYRHMIVFLLFMAQFLYFGITDAMSLALVAMTDVNSTHADITIFNWDSSIKSLILSSCRWGVVAVIPYGYITARFNAHILLCMGYFISGISYYFIPLLAEKGGYAFVIGCAFVSSLGLTTISPCINHLLSKWVPVSERARFGGWVLGAGNAGTVFSMSVGGLLVNSKFGWPIIFYTFGTITLCWSILFYFLGANSPSVHPKISLEEVEYIESSLETRKQTTNEKSKIPLKSIFTSLPVWAYHICMWGQIYNITIFTSYLPTIMKDTLNFDTEQSGWISALPFAIKWLFVMFLGWFMDYVLKRGLSVTAGRKIANTVGMWAPAASLFSLCFIGTENKIVIISILILTLGMNSAVLCGFFLAPLDLCPNHAGTVCSISAAVGGIIGLSAPLVTGAIVTDTSNFEQWHHAFYLSICIYFLSNLFYIIFGSAEKQSWNDQDSFNTKSCAKGDKPSGWIASLPFVIKWLFSVIISWIMDVALRSGLSVTAGRKLANTLAMWGPAAVLLGICFVKPEHKIIIIPMLVATLGFNSSVVCGSLLTPLDLCPNYASTIVTIRYTISAFINLLVPVITSAFVTDTSNIEQWHKVFYLSIGVYFFANLVDVIFGSAKKNLGTIKIVLQNKLNKSC